MAKVLAIGDLHAPFQHPDAIPFLKRIYKSFKCDKVICLGDELDVHAISRHPVDPNGLSPGDELEAGLEFMHKLYKVFPNVQVCVSNHTSRPYRASFAAGIPTNFLREYHEWMEAPKNWSWHDRIVVDGVQYIHGEGFTGRNAHMNAALKYRMSTVIGHIHRFAGVQYSASVKDEIFGFNVGCLVDNDAYAFAYAKHIPDKSTIGCGVIIDGRQAIYIPMD